MTNYLLAATALATGLAAIATPAAARDRSAYFGIEVGALQVSDTDMDIDFDGDLEDDFFDGFDVEHKIGVDGDLIAGYDFGMFRLEAELGYKRSHHEDYSVDIDFDDDDDEIADAAGRSSVYSLMANAMVDVGHDQGVNFYAGAGIGYAQVIHLINPDGPGDRWKVKDRGLAWQLIAGVRYPMWTHFDVGVKYRYFNANDIGDRFDFDEEEEEFGIDADYKSHSLLLSLIYNFNAPTAPPPPLPVMAPPPPPPAPPATQTCPDGSVILATDACPLPPPPPPPPPPEPERG